MLSTGVGNWLLRFLAAHAAKATVSSTLKAEGDLSKERLERLTADVLDDPRKLDLVLAMAGAAADHAHRGRGIDNDGARFAEIASLELERVAAPSLVINGTADADVPPSHSDHAAATIPGAERMVLEGGTHLALWVHPDAEATQARVAAALR